MYLGKSDKEVDDESIQTPYVHFISTELLVYLGKTEKEVDEELEKLLQSARIQATSFHTLLYLSHSYTFHT